MVDRATPRSLSATIARHHRDCRLRIVLHVGPNEHFVLLSSADGATAIHVAIDADGNIGGDWWGQADGNCPAAALQVFAERHELPLSELLSVVRPFDTLTPTLSPAANRNRTPEGSPETCQRLLPPTTHEDTPSIGYPNDGDYVVLATAVSRANEP
jgi:hypothetical protein